MTELGSHHFVTSDKTMHMVHIIWQAFVEKFRIEGAD